MFYSLLYFSFGVAIAIINTKCNFVAVTVSAMQHEGSKQTESMLNTFFHIKLSNPAGKGNPPHHLHRRRRVLL